MAVHERYCPNPRNILFSSEMAVTPGAVIGKVPDPYEPTGPPEPAGSLGSPACCTPSALPKIYPELCILIYDEKPRPGKSSSAPNRTGPSTHPSSFPPIPQPSFRSAASNGGGGPGERTPSARRTIWSRLMCGRRRYGPRYGTWTHPGRTDPTRGIYGTKSPKGWRSCASHRRPMTSPIWQVRKRRVWMRS